MITIKLSKEKERRLTYYLRKTYGKPRTSLSKLLVMAAWTIIRPEIERELEEAYK